MLVKILTGPTIYPVNRMKSVIERSIVETSLLPPQPDAEDGEIRPIEPLLGANYLRLLRRILIFMLGMGVLIIGVVMIIAPGPAVLIIPLGLAILATEFVWARRLLTRVKERLKRSPASGGPRPPEES